MFLAKHILDMSGEFKMIHFTSSNLLCDFPNGKWKKKKILLKNFHAKNTSQTNMFLTRIKWPVINLQPDWPDLNPTWPNSFPSLVNALNEKPLYILEIYGFKKSVN